MGVSSGRFLLFLLLFLYLPMFSIKKIVIVGFCVMSTIRALVFCSIRQEKLTWWFVWPITFSVVIENISQAFVIVKSMFRSCFIFRRGGFINICRKSLMRQIYEKRRPNLQAASPNFVMDEGSSCCSVLAAHRCHCL
jgi:hypothetical protein